MGDQDEIRRFGLALSGGGFRAALYHLGVIRFLRDAGILSLVTHITSVSGGSVIGAHLALNWNRYCGTDEDFQNTAEELLQFLKLDVRNRIVRRFPPMAAVNAGRRAMRMETRRQYTRAGLLEHHYEKYLYGDTALFALPDAPRLYILATNLSEGSLCAFHKDGLLLQRRSLSEKQMHFEEVEIGLATVPMAVAASSAFPGFFPPLELQGKDVCAKGGQFARHAFTDGGIYDNIGLRMFRHLWQMAGENGFAGVVVSDAGATFKVRSEIRAGGLLSTALRSSDILMNRVNELEQESFLDTPGVHFLPITQLVRQTDDPTAPHHEIQRQAALIRTDMDQFSNLEITALVQHGYCVARQVCRENTLVPTDSIPTGPPWNPLNSRSRLSDVDRIDLSDPRHSLKTARLLQGSAVRRVFSTLLSFRDWPTYVWLPLFTMLITIIPFVLYTSRATAIQQGQVLSAVAQTSPLYRDVLELLQNETAPSIPEISFEEAESIEPLDFTGYDVVTDDRIYDLRGWTSNKSEECAPMMHARFRMQKTELAREQPTLRIQLPSGEDSMRVEYLPRTLLPKHIRTRRDDGLYLYETAWIFLMYRLEERPI